MAYCTKLNQFKDKKALQYQNFFYFYTKGDNYRKTHTTHTELTHIFPTTANITQHLHSLQ